MPYLSWKKYKSVVFTCIQTLVSFLWITVLVYYVLNISVGEHGVVIVGMFIMIPILCLITHTISAGLHLIKVHFNEVNAIEKGI
mgnify:FL=1